MPVTVAVNCWLPVAVAGDTVTPVTVEVAAAIVTVAIPDFVPSCALVAVTVMVCVAGVAAGAVNRPPLVMLPDVAVHVTDWLGPFAPMTVAANCWLPVVLDGETLTLVTVDPAAAAIVAVAVPDFVPSCVLVAVIVTV